LIRKILGFTVRNRSDKSHRSVQTFGFNVPVLIDGKGQLIAGHGRRWLLNS